MIRRLTFGTLLLAVSAFLIGGCGAIGSDPPGSNDDIALKGARPGTVVPGTRLELRGGPFENDDSVTVSLSGESDAGAFDVSLGGGIATTRRIEVPIGASVFDEIGPSDGPVSTQIRLRVSRGDRTLTATRRVELDFERSLKPAIRSVSPTRAGFMDRLTVEGRRLLRNGEGETVVRFDGTFRRSNGTTRAIEDAVVALEPISRTESHYVHTPEVFGLYEGTFEGTVTVENFHQTGDEVSGNTLDLTLEVMPPRIESVDPDAISRGQRLTIRGVGLVPREPDHRQRTTLILEGSFTDTEGRSESIHGSDAIRIEPNYRESGVLEYVLRPDVEDDELVGLGSEPGTFEGSIRARVTRGDRTMTTPKHDFRLKILPTKQVVHLKYLPGFSNSLRKFGLRNVENQIKARILEVCNRDYKPYNLVCRESPPEAFADYTTLEIGGRDPNDASLFGLDNTEGFDDGNHRLDEVIGGRRATDESRENFSYGGVFIESFLIFSPTLTRSIPIESERFDDIFGPFIPDLGGRPVQVDEYPSGPRVEKVDRAIRVLGNLVGNTAVHEIGHALGLARTGISGNVHHQGLKPNLIMNAGADRSFARRAEIDGKEPSVWGARDSRYLERILPKP